MTKNKAQRELQEWKTSAEDVETAPFPRGSRIRTANTPQWHSLSSWKEAGGFFPRRERVKPPTTGIRSGRGRVVKHKSNHHPHTLQHRTDPRVYNSISNKIQKKSGTYTVYLCSIFDMSSSEIIDIQNNFRTIL